jgi:hypothetical protein
MHKIYLAHLLTPHHDLRVFESSLNAFCKLKKNAAQQISILPIQQHKFVANLIESHVDDWKIRLYGGLQT